MKDLKNLKGAKMLSKMDQKVIKGGKIPKPTPTFCTSDDDCEPSQICSYELGGVCVWTEDPNLP